MIKDNVSTIITHKYYCECCNYKTNRYINITRHNLTTKHKKLSNIETRNEPKKNICNTCNKEYAHASSLCKHKKTCHPPITIIKKEEPPVATIVTLPYKCAKCNKEYAHASSLCKHKKTCNPTTITIKRKEPKEDVVTTLPYKCANCNKGYEHASSLCKHKKKCNISTIPKNKQTEALVTTLLYECMNCNKKYIYKTGLCKHKKTCQSNTNDSNVMLKMVELMCQNNQLQSKNNELQNNVFIQNNTIIEKLQETTALVHSNIQPVQNNIQTNIQNNIQNTQHFNLSVFLNDTCKDAINITDFINSMKLTVKDFEETGRIGYIEGITKIFLNSLNQYEENKRPLHCTDMKRETVYVKNNDVWEKDNDNDKKYLKWAVGAVAQLNLNQHVEWQKEHPDCTVNNTNSNNTFMQLTRTALGGHANNQEGKNIEKIMKNVLKEVLVGKKQKDTVTI